MEGDMDTSSIMQDKVRVRAYDIYKEQGMRQGKDLDYWLQAKKEIFQELKEEIKRNIIREYTQSKFVPA